MGREQLKEGLVQQLANRQAKGKIAHNALRALGWHACCTRTMGTVPDMGK